jgi:dTDP-4-dehydrorhamnose reductase
LIFGGRGWLGGLLHAMLKEQGEEVHLARARLEDRAAIQKDLLEFRPRYVLNVAGIVRAHLFLLSCLSSLLSVAL